MTATRTDPATGVVEEIGYFGPDEQMLGAFHLPADATAGVLMCSSTHAEQLKAYHQEVEVARKLAESGVAVRRFQYRGTGNSLGDEELLDLPGILEDATTAMESLLERTGDVPIGFMAVRIGAFPAVLKAIEHGSGPIALWAPVYDTDAYMTDALQSHYIASIKGESKPRKQAELMEELETEGTIELTGYTFHRRFYDSIKGKRLADHIPTGHPVMIVPFDPIDPADLAEPWQAAGVDVEQLDSSGREAWWLGDRAGEDRRNRREALIDHTAGWLLHHLT